MPEITGAQHTALALSLYDDQDLPLNLPATYESYRTVRKQATVQFARAMAKAPILAAEWTIEADDEAPEGAQELIEDVMLDIRPILLGSGLCGVLDFGWSPFEIIWELIEGDLIPIKTKPLLQDITSIHVDRRGQMSSLCQNDGVEVPIELALVLHGEVEGTYWYSMGRLEVVRGLYNRWVEWDHGAARYDKKVAGSHVVVNYPVGSTDVAGVNTPNETIAKSILTQLRSSSGLILPRMIPRTTHGVTAEMVEHIQWGVELLSDSGAKQPAFLPRGEYLDKLIIRSYFLPERSVSEGQFGTKAEAGEHASFALTDMDLRHKDLVRLINWHLVNRILVANYGMKAQNTVRILASPIADEKKTLFHETLATILKTQGGLEEMLDRIDLDSIVEAAGLPMLDEDDREALRAERELNTPEVTDALDAAVEDADEVTNG